MRHASEFVSISLYLQRTQNTEQKLIRMRKSLNMHKVEEKLINKMET